LDPKTLEVDKFSKLLKINLQTGLWEYENNRYKTAEVNFPVYIFPTGSFEIGNNKELIRFKEDLNSNNLPQVIDDILSVLFFNFYRDRVKPVISSNNKFSSEIQPISLIGFIWHELFKIIENNKSEFIKGICIACAFKLGFEAANNYFELNQIQFERVETPKTISVIILD
jgi:hypothetical protein